MNNRNKGLTPKQIKEVVKGFAPKAPKVKTLSRLTKDTRPVKQFRKLQNGNNGLLLNLPFTSTRAAFEYITPEWFTSKTKADVSVIVPLYNSTAQNLIQSWDLDNDGVIVELIFVDDNCPVNSKESVINEWNKRLSELKKPVGRIYCSTDKQGWGACCNIGAEKATGDIVVFLHPETIVTQNWLKPVLELLADGESVVSTLQVDPKENTIVDIGAEWSWEQNQFLDIGVDCYKGKKISKSFKLDNIPLDLLGTDKREKTSSYCLAIRKDLFRYHGGFSANLISSYWADADFCMSLKERGHQIVCQCDSQVYRTACDVSHDRQYEAGKTYFRNKWIVSRRIEKLVVAPRDTPTDEIQTIVIRRRAAHGDVLMAAAVAPALKKKYPDAKIVFSTDCPEVLENNPWIDQVVAIHSERWFQLYYDLDMIYEYRPDANIMTAYAEAVGVDPKDCDLFLPSAPLDVELPENYVVIHAGKTLWAGRNWTTLKFDSVSNKLKAAGYKVVCVGTWSDHKTTSCDLDLRDKTTIPQLASVILNAKGFVGIDSFPMHVAQTFEVPGVCFFGAIKPETRLVNSSIRPVVASGLSCLGCHHRKSTPCTSTSVCDVGIQDCINNVSAERLWQTLKAIL